MYEGKIMHQDNIVVLIGTCLVHLSGSQNNGIGNFFINFYLRAHYLFEMQMKQVIVM